MSTVVVLVDKPETAYRYHMLIEPLGLDTKAVNAFAPLLSCIVDPSSVLVLVEDAFIENTSAHRLIDQIRSMPGKPSQIPILRVWKRLVLTAGGCSQRSVETITAPVTGHSLSEALKRLGLIKQRLDK